MRLREKYFQKSLKGVSSHMVMQGHVCGDVFDMC